MAKVLTFLGTRSEIIKLSPVIQLLSQSFDHILVHSGQHFLPDMAAVFFEELGLSKPRFNLQVGSDSPTRQIAHMMTGLEEILIKEQPGALVVLGGTSTALAGALVGVKLGLRVAHLEAGVRTFNWHAPEEINRMLIDRMSTWLFAPDEAARGHLLAEGLEADKIRVVGSTTVDACRRHARLADSRSIVSRLKLSPQEYLVLTLHRAENTQPDVLNGILKAVNALSRIWPIIFPIHPRTLRVLAGEDPFNSNVTVIDPLRYLDMLKLVSNARALLTDSSSLQEEAALLGTPALILRNETEWRYLIDAGVNALVGNTYQSLMDRAWPLIASETALESMRQRAITAPGGASLRIVQILETEWDDKGLTQPVSQPPANPN